MKPKKTAVEWFNEEIKELFNQYQNEKISESMLHFNRLLALNQAKEMEKEQRDTLLNYIEEVRDLCRKLRFPTEGELKELTDKADVILETFKQQEQ